MSFGGRAPPGPAGETYSAPPDSPAALKLLARLRRSDTERPSSFFPLEHGYTPLPAVAPSLSSFCYLQAMINQRANLADFHLQLSIYQ